MKLGKTFDWDCSTIDFSKNLEEAKKNAYYEFETVANRTAVFDHFSERVKIHRFEQVIRSLDKKIKKGFDYSKELLLQTYYKLHPDYIEIEIEGYERPIGTLKKKPFPKPENLEDTQCVAGYVFQDGTFYGCHYEGHTSLCSDFLEMGLLKDKNDPYYEADRVGWLKVSDLRFLKFRFNFGHGHRPTEKQREFVERAKKKIGSNVLFLNDKELDKL